jgi:hypothetical protein
MSVNFKFEPIDRDIAFLLSEELSPAAQSASLAAFAEEQRDDALSANTTALGSAPPYDTFVDGARSSHLEGVRPNGVIVFEFELFVNMMGWIDLQLITHSPVRSGRYRRSHVLFADGVEVDQSGNAPLPDAREFVYLNMVPYARLIERGLSKQAPDGVYQGIALMAARRFGNLAAFKFEYRRVANAGRGGRDDRQPAIVITV